MKRQVLLCSLIFVFWTTAHALPARAAPAKNVQIRAGPLSESLAQLARQMGIELLYDRRIVSGARSPEVRGSLLPEQALARLLSGTGVGYRKNAQGVFVLFAVAPRPAEVARQEPVPEIFVIGIRSQNADIRRTRNDIQPYVVSTRSDIENAHRDNVDGFMRNRIPANAQVVPPILDTFFNPGAVNSQIDLRGLGTLRSLVLVDGRRMPSLPTPQFDFGQADVNALPIGAIERIETLTGTAGGIYGPGAIGGVVNIVLRRDYRGADVHLVSGISSRGDARRLGIEARIGFTPDDGRTDVMIFGSRTTVHPLLAGELDFARRARSLRFRNDPEGYLSDPSPSAAVSVFSQAGNLTFDPELGGGMLNSPYSFIPAGLSGSSADRTGLLTSNAGQLIFDLPPDDSGTERYVLSNPTVTSAIVNVRHRFSDKVEAFADFLYFRDDGRFHGSAEPFQVVTPADSPNNPFQQPVIFEFPNLTLKSRVRTTLRSTRLTAGVIAELGGSWKGTADLTTGEVKTSLRTVGSDPSAQFQLALARGTVGSDGLPILDPLGDWNRFVESTRSLAETLSIGFNQVNRFRAGSVRVAGPLVSLPGGLLNVTFLVERRREHNPLRHFTFSGSTFDLEFPFPLRTQTVTSGYAELRAPILARDTKILPLRGLELQLAGRYDRVKTLVPENAAPSSPTNDQLVSLVSGGPTFTAGARVFPLRDLMLRASIATGELPPTIQQLAVNAVTFDDTQTSVSDPLRDQRRLGSEGPVLYLQGGSHDLSPEHATTISIGAVINPDGGALPRISLDYSRVDVRHEVTYFTTLLSQVLANESAFPGRVVRAPLTDEDRALGFTAGRVLSIDSGASNSGQTIVQVVDAQLDWIIPAGRLGQLRLYGNATWYPSYKTRSAPDASWGSSLGYSNGPLTWRGNLGLDWTKGPLLVGLNAQYYDSYRVTYFGETFASYNERRLRYQGSPRFKPQTFVDLTVRRKFVLPDGHNPKSIDLNFGIQNLFDRRPAIVADPNAQNFSFYADPRRRRFELIVSADF